MRRSRLGALLACVLHLSCGGVASIDETYSDAVRADTPASYWRFGEARGARIAYDQLGRADATVTSGVTAGVPGALTSDRDTGLAFDGASGAVIGPDVDTFEGTHPFTVEVWIQPRAGGLPIQRVCNHRLGPDHTGWRLFIDETKHVVFERWDHDEILSSVGAPLAVDVFSHVVARYDGSTLTLYVNGAAVAEARDTRPIGHFSAPLVWGSASTYVLDFFLGSLDEAAIYERALPEDRIALHHAKGVHRRDSP